MIQKALVMAIKVSLKDTECSVRASKVYPTVILQHCSRAGNSRHYSLGSAAETRKKVRFDKAGSNTDIGFHHMLIDQRRPPRSSHSHLKGS